MNKLKFFVPCLAVILLVSGCDSDDDPAPVVTANYYVDAVSGSDGNAGGQAQPFKTITKALSVAQSNQVIQVLPGLYDAANGEIFPLVIPNRVTLQGNIATRGDLGGIPVVLATRIVGGGADTATGANSVAVEMSNFSVLTGFIVHPLDTVGGSIIGVVANLASSVGIIRNTLDGLAQAGRTGAQVGGILNEVSDNAVRGNTVVGLNFVDCAECMVTYNSIGKNATGVTVNGDPSVDLGGGAVAGTLGNNSFFCHTTTDLDVTGINNINATVSADGNSWDTIPPSQANAGTPNILSDAATTITTVNGFLFDPNCT
jgi:hypothetical protein